MEEINSKYKDIMVLPNLTKLHHDNTNEFTSKQYLDYKDKEKKLINNKLGNYASDGHTIKAVRKGRDYIETSLPLGYNRSMNVLVSFEQAAQKAQLLSTLRKRDFPTSINDSYDIVKSKLLENASLRNYPTMNAPPKHLSTTMSSISNRLVQRSIKPLNFTNNINNSSNNRNNFPNKPVSANTNINPAYKSVLLNNKQKLFPIHPKLNSHSINYSSARDNYLMPNKYDAYQSLVTRERFDILKAKASAALNEGKTFSIVSNTNGSSIVRRALLRRGWLERFSTAEDKGSLHEHFLHAPDREAMIMSKFLRNKPVRLIWGEGINWSLINPNTLVNKFPLAGKSLSTKTGLLKYLQSQVWTVEEGKSQVKYPRTFSIYEEADLNYFASQYRITACVNMLKKFCSGMLDKKSVLSDSGTVCIKNLDFAIERVCEYIGVFEHAYVDLWNYSIVSETDWDNFLTEYYQFAHHGRQIKNTEKYEVDKLLTSAEACLDKIRLYWPESDYEGYENVWLIKPAAQSCGRGIVILKQLKDILTHCGRRQTAIVQKYIERPCLVYNTKFDIRQWFLVASSSPMRIYMYGKNYLRFCSKEFSLSNLHESVHLSNNSIQYKYEATKKNNPKLPRQNMWSSDTFQEYLRSRGEAEKWTNIVIPGIRRCIIGAMLAAQESMSDRQNSFNLYGADFLLTEAFTPLLIEINSCPCMRSSTDVTAKLCPMVLEDTIQVVTSPSPRPTHNTGLFQLIYDQTLSYDVPSPLREKDPELVIIAKKARIHTLPRDVYKNQSVEPLVEYNKKHSHWEDRSLKYDNLTWYKSKRPALMIVPTLDPRLSFGMPKYPGDVTSVKDIVYVTKSIERPIVTKWMESCRSWIARQIMKDDNNNNNIIIPSQNNSK